MKEAAREEQDGGRGVGVYSARADVTDKTSEESEVLVSSVSCFTTNQTQHFLKQHFILNFL